jgi:hypothetical protein
VQNCDSILESLWHLLATIFLRQFLVSDIFLQLTMPKCFPALIAASIQLTAVLIFLNVDAILGVGNQIGRSHKWEEWGVWSVTSMGSSEAMAFED